MTTSGARRLILASLLVALALPAAGHAATRTTDRAVQRGLDGLVAAKGGPPGAIATLYRHGRTTIGPGKFHDCFWSIGAINGGAMNIAYPDAGANYWAAGYAVPAGATLELTGTFPHARFASCLLYTSPSPRD